MCSFSKLMALSEEASLKSVPVEIVPLKKILLDENIQNKILKNADEFVHKFLTNPGTASKKFLEHLQKY